MIKYIYTIKDELTGYNAPFLQENDEEATRTLKILTNDENSNIYQSPEDYSIWNIGNFNQTDGCITTITPQLVARAKGMKD